MTLRMARNPRIGMFPRPHLKFRLYDAAGLAGWAKVFAGWPKLCEFPGTDSLIINPPCDDVHAEIGAYLKRQP